MAIFNCTNLEECCKLTNNTYSKNEGKCQRKLLTFSNMLAFERRAKKNGKGRERELDNFNLLDEVYLYIMEKRYLEEYTATRKRQIRIMKFVVNDILFIEER